MEREAKELFSGVEGQWVSYGTVDPETDDQHSVAFDPDRGPLVNVTLQPSGVPVVCRVGGAIAGNGEAEYYPFVQGDEVLVAIPEGNERAGCMIVARGNSQIDKFPLTVFGADVTLNNFGFRRMRAPYMIETAAAYGIRNAVTSAMFMMGADGTTTLSDGFLDSLHMGPDFVGLQATDDAPSVNPFANPSAFLALIQLDKNNKLIALEVQNKAKMVLGTSLDGIGTAGRFFVQASGSSISEHVTTAEAMVNFLNQVLLGLSALSAPGALGPLAGQPVRTAFLTAALAAAADPATGSLDPALLQALQTALAAKQNNPTGLIPNVGSAGFLTG